MASSSAEVSGAAGARAGDGSIRLELSAVLRGVLSAWAVLGLELAAVVVLARRELAGVWEIERGTLYLAPTALLVAAAFGALGAVAFAIAERGSHPVARGALAACIGGAGAAVGWGVGGGRHLTELSSRAGFALLVASSAGLFAYWLLPRLSRWIAVVPRRTALALAILLVALEVANRVVLPRLYPAFHWTLSAMVLTLAPFVSGPLLAGSSEAGAQRFRSALLLASAFVIPGLLVGPSARRLSLLDNYRFVLLERAPVLGRIVEAAARVAPPEPWDGASVCAPPDPCSDATVSAPGRSLELRGRDILLVTIDALRADHVGAYGYGRSTTPNLDRLAKDGVLFEHAYTATPHTSYAIASLMTGKYMRPLLLQGAGADSDTWASLLRTYGYKTAAFYPPAVFFIDTTRFESFQKNNLGFEYFKVEFADGEPRIGQVAEYLASAAPNRPLFVWVHLFGPHEPYVAHPEHPFGDRDIDRYDSEIAAADHTLGTIVQKFRDARPKAAVFVTADHGEEFGEHGGRYHGTTVYEEQLRVPLVVSAPGLLSARRVREVVSTTDLLPTVLSGLSIPRPPRLRGRDLGALLLGAREEEAGIAHGETDDQSLLAQGTLRLVCARRIGACKLYDLDSDPKQTVDASAQKPADFGRLREALRALGASHGRYESQGLRAEGKGWPEAIVRGLAGDGEVAAEIASLLDDVDPIIRRKAAETLIELRRPETAPALRLALGRDEDAEVRKFSALALTRLGEGAPLVLELLDDPRYRRIASLALGESGDARGRPGLLEWWQDETSRDFARSKQILNAFGVLRAKEAVPLLCADLDDVRLRPELAATLARIGEESARMPLVRALADERAVTTRVALVRALVELGGRYELVPPLVRFMGVPDPLPDALLTATEAGILAHVGGPGEKELPRLHARSELGTRVRLVIPKGGNGRGVRALVRAECEKGTDKGELLLSGANHLVRYDRQGKLLPQRKVPELDASRALRFSVPCSGSPVELFATIPESIDARPGMSIELIAFTSRGVRVHALALVPLADELPPPPPRPWAASDSTPSSTQAVP